ncbi:MAG: NfeD family protein [Eubacteriaceae bacterium]|jgi:membrane protein implicated in regulation of membrane protease activity|nr:NfeD family protein [Eubacteriaceae bacterium]
MGALIIILSSRDALIWIGIIVLSIIIEAATVGLASIWFALGGVAALVCALLNLQFWLQAIVFLSSSVALLLLTRPILIDLLHVGERKTNVEELIGEVGVVVKDIREFESGQVKVKGAVWTAVPIEEAVILKGERVEIERIEGVKLIVRTRFD